MFESAKLKVKRAYQHIADLRSVAAAFTSKLHNFGFYNEANAMIVEVRLSEPIPSALPLLIGDAVHNLRTALDHATWELIGLDGGKQHRWLAFPMHRTRRDYEAACRGIETPRRDTVEFLLAFEAYPGGSGDKLFGLNVLDNIDKHQIFTPIAGVATLRHAEVVKPDGQVMTTIKNCKFGMGPDGRAKLMRLGPGLAFKFDEKCDPTVDIFFGEVEFFEAEQLIPTLMHLSETVSHALRQFNDFVSGRA